MAQNILHEGVRCRCGNHVEGSKELKDIKVDLSNPGTVEFKAPARSCNNCGESVFEEDDSDAVFSAFDQAYKEKH